MRALRPSRPLILAALSVLANAALAATPEEEAAEWLRTLGVPLADAKGFVAPTPESVAEIKWVSFARVRAGRLDPADLAKLRALSKLEEIVFGGNAATDAGVAALARAVPRLRRLWLVRSAVTDAAFPHVATLAELEALHLAGAKVSAAAMISVARLRKLRLLELDETAVGDAGLEAITGMPSLRELSYKDMRGVGDRGVAALAALRRLDTLHLAFAEVDGSLERLGASRSLRRLYLVRATVDDARAAALAKVKTLRVLALSYTAVGDAALPHVAGLPNLATLDLIGTKITDRGMAALARAKALVELDLMGTGVGDAGLDALLDLPKLASLVLLKHVDLAATAVTADGAAALRRALPAARVVASGE